MDESELSLLLWSLIVSRPVMVDVAGSRRTLIVYSIQSCQYCRPGRPEESRVPEANARRIAFVSGMSRRMARVGAWALAENDRTAVVANNAASDERRITV